MSISTENTEIVTWEGNVGKCVFCPGLYFKHQDINRFEVKGREQTHCTNSNTRMLGQLSYYRTK